jgi:uncharacterized protein (TIGR00369 family)
MADGESGERQFMVAGEGEWAGWFYFQGLDPFEDLTGPYYMREEPDGTRRSAFRIEPRHLNGGGGIHGGCLMTFADFALFAIGHQALKDCQSVTASLNGEFVGPAGVGDLIEASGQVVRNGKSLVFIRGLITCAGEPLLNFSGIVKKGRPRGPDGSPYSIS